MNNETSIEQLKQESYFEKGLRNGNTALYWENGNIKE